MMDMNVADINQRVARKQASLFKGRTIKHSDIVCRSRDKELSSILVAGDPVPCNGGSMVVAEDNGVYKIYAFYMPDVSSAGRHLIKTGHKTIIAVHGVLHITLENSKSNKKDMLRAGERLSLGKGDTYSVSTGNFNVECIVVESADYREKELNPPLVSEGGLAEYRIVRDNTVPVAEIASLPIRRRKTKEEREQFGLRVQEAQGVIPQVARENLSATRKLDELRQMKANTAVEGINPAPIGSSVVEAIQEVQTNEQA